MTQRSKDFRNGFLAAFGFLALAALAACIAYSADKVPSANVIAGTAAMFAAWIFGAGAIILLGGTFIGMHEPSDKEPSNGSDNA